jgi:protein-S-isoprenylcysteine O-methyltransferase Ste14
MDHEQPFRTFLIVGFLLVFPIAMSYRIRSQATREKLDRRQEGWFILATLRPVGLILWMGLFAYMINPSWMAWSSVPLPVWLRWTGAGVWVIGAGLLIWTLHSLGKNLTDTVVTRKEHTLVTRGPYRWVRHPFYVCAGLLIFASSLIAANWFIFAGIAAFLSLVVLRTRTEEEKLLARFGDDYRAYMARTGRFFPRF